MEQVALVKLPWVAVEVAGQSYPFYFCFFRRQPTASRSRGATIRGKPATKYQRQDSDLRHGAYETPALPLSYVGKNDCSLPRRRDIVTPRLGRGERRAFYQGTTELPSRTILSFYTRIASLCPLFCDSMK